MKSKRLVIKPKPKVVKCFKHGDSIVMTIPAQFAEMLDIGPGDFLQVSIKDNRLIVEKVTPPLFNT